MVLEYLVTFLLFFLPFLIVPFGNLIFEPSKVIAAQLAIILLFFFFILKEPLSINRFNKKQLFLVGILFISSLLQLVFTPSEGNFFGNVFRLQGVFLFWNLLLFSLLSSQLSLERINKNIYMGALVFLSISSLFLWKDPSGRFVGTLGEPNALAATAVYIFCFVFFNFGKIGKVLGATFTILAIYLSSSHSGSIALIVIALFWVLAGYLKQKVVKATIIALLVVFLSLFLPFLEDSLKQASLKELGQFNFESRVEVWETAFIAGFEKPVLGWGFGNIQEALRKTSKSLNNNIQYQVVDSSHNFLLDFWVQSGIIGLISILALIFFSFKNFLKREDYLYLSIGLGLITVLLFNPASVVVLIAFWWVIGQG